MEHRGVKRKVDSLLLCNPSNPPPPFGEDDLWCYERPSFRRCYCGAYFYDVFDDYQCIGCSGLSYKIVRQLCAIGYRDGFDYGVDCAIADTVNHLEPRTGVDMDSVSKIPYLAWADRSAYNRAFERGFKVSYNEVYRAHARVFEELVRLQTRQLGLAFLIHRVEKNDWFDPELIRMVGSYLEK